MKPFGLTGGMGCGKTAVARLLSEHSDVEITDCDMLAKEIVNSQKYRKEICAILGTNVYFSGSADSRLMARIVFGDHNKKYALEEFIHPLLWGALRKRSASLDPRTIHVVESAIIYEIGSEDKFAAVIVATCDPTEQLRRLREIRKMDPTDIEVRLRTQIPNEEKVRLARFVIHTDCELEELGARAEALYQNLKRFKGDSS